MKVTYQSRQNWLKRISLFLFFCILPLVGLAESSATLKKGRYLLRASGGCSCHTDPGNKSQYLAGGRGIKTPFGVIYSTNITPDKKTGIGSWSETDFIRSMSKGVRADGKHLYPVFPYTSFTGMKAEDIAAIKAYIFSLPPIEKKNRSNDIFLPLRLRFGLFFWKFIFFKPGEYKLNADRSAEWNRGFYLVNALAHCGECHTPRNLLGGLKKDLLFAGSVDGPEGQLAPNITPDKERGIGNWSLADMTWFLGSGLKPDGDDTQGLMSEVIDQGYQYLSQEDLKAMAIYLKSLKPINRQVGN